MRVKSPFNANNHFCGRGKKYKVEGLFENLFQLFVIKGYGKNVKLKIPVS